MSYNIEERIAMAKNHYTHHSGLLGQWQPMGNDWPLLNEYIASCTYTLIMGTLLYFIASGLSYLVFFVWFKQRFTPRRHELLYDHENYWFDIKWSMLNILGQVPLVTLIKMGYPYFSKIQYSFQFKPIFLLYLLLHIMYDQFFTYWFHRLLHHPRLYPWLHVIHHKSKTVTPFTGFAFHPLDAFMQAVPVFTSCYFLPLPIDLVIAHAFMTSIWAISIHDNVNFIPFKGILYAGSHSIHHFPWGQNYNYGKFTSVCDRLYGTYCDPENIAGYGYETGPSFGAIIKKMNQVYSWIVPDKGVEIVSKIRNIYAKKLK